MRAWLCVLALAGCDRVFGIGDPYEDAAVATSGSDAAPDAPGHVVDGLPVPTLAMVAHLPFDGDTRETISNTLAMPSGSGVAPHATGGEFMGYVGLDGASCLSFPEAATPSAFSIEVWARSTSATPTTSVLASRTFDTTTDSWAFIATSMAVTFHMHDSTGDQLIPSTKSLSTSWQQFVFTYDGSTGRLYVDGSPVAMMAMMAPQYRTDAQVYLGCSATLTTSKLAGGLDEVQIYDGALSDTQVMTLYTQATL